VTIEQNEASHSAASATYNVPASLIGRDTRPKRPPLLTLLIRVALGRFTRVLSLLVLDFIGVLAALYTALVLKLALRGELSTAAAWGQTRSALAFAYMVTVLMFARVDLYATRPRRRSPQRCFRPR
jgi:hypothetical protein